MEGLRQAPSLSHPEVFWGNRLSIEIYTDERAISTLDSDVTHWRSGIGILGGTHRKRMDCADSPDGDLRRNPPLGKRSKVSPSFN